MTSAKRKNRHLGILSLDTQFPRILGDVGNPVSYPFETSVKVVCGADATKIVKDGLPEESLLHAFELAALELQANGANAIVSTCGFLITAQSRIASKVKIPVMLSALSMLPTVQAVAATRIGILTASGGALGSAALVAARISPEDVVIQGMESAPLFANAFLARRDQQVVEFDRTAMERAVVEQAIHLVRAAPDVGAILLECGNLPPYAEAIKSATGRPVYHLLDAALWMMAASGSTA
ncbi:aspartate/glutamate racemase family protein [Sulfitobacter sp. W074]|uniref:aspartate/glutamate racemase family protein n=1 Tax=Sulfitobacter sp. W074 TaxID=2867026 RepID=UPI0021A5DB6A|nr:aspartate/glutamate racemase family protein [Sulfitobacter sp. W074]UWR38436.1 aspartate/glutamate racemase family protein [Sulfitobacter sp. W074]